MQERDGSRMAQAMGTFGARPRGEERKKPPGVLNAAHIEEGASSQGTEPLAQTRSNPEIFRTVRMLHPK